jgi:4-hydroxybenzoate polyprenyltransferase
MDPGDPTTAQRERRFQFDLRTLLAVTAIVALSAAAISPRVSLVALLLAVVAIPILTAAVCVWNRWPWWIGLVFLLVLAAALTPADPLSMNLFQAPACVVYGLSMLLWQSMQKRQIDRRRAFSSDTRSRGECKGR